MHLLYAGTSARAGVKKSFNRNLPTSVAFARQKEESPCFIHARVWTVRTVN